MSHSDQPNILFVFPDQHRFDWVGANKNLSLRTPHLDALAAWDDVYQLLYASSYMSPREHWRPVVDMAVPASSIIVRIPLSKPNYYRTLNDAGYEVCGVGIRSA